MAKGPVAPMREEALPARQRLMKLSAGKEEDGEEEKEAEGDVNEEEGEKGVCRADVAEMPLVVTVCLVARVCDW